MKKKCNERFYIECLEIEYRRFYGLSKECIEQTYSESLEEVADSDCSMLDAFLKAREKLKNTKK